ncbi:MAG: nitrite/sulfite reductase [Thermoprotei archaeon]
MLEASELENIIRFADRFTLGFENGNGSQFFLRISVPNGILTTEQFRTIANLAEMYGRGYAEVTDRQDIQLHWVDPEKAFEIFSVLDQIGFTTDKCGQSYPGARYGDIRNIVGCPVAGVDKHEIFNAYPLVKEMKRFFTGNKDFLDLPRKFKISISGCAINCSSPEIQDLGLIALARGEKIGFIPFVGGGLGYPPKLAKPLGIIVNPEDVVKFVVTVVEIYRDYGRRDNKAKARFKWLVEELGCEKLREIIENKLGITFEKYNHIQLSISGKEHTGINPQKQNNLWYICVPLLGGRLDSKQMLSLASIAEKYGWPEIRLTPHQNIILVGIQANNIKIVLNELEKIGLNVGIMTMKYYGVACPGGFCGKSPEDPKARLNEIITYIESKFPKELIKDIRIYISGCPNACGKHPIGDIGLQGVYIKDKNSMHAGYNIFLGGGLGYLPSFARLIKRNVKADDVKFYIERIISAYLRDRRKNEVFKDFCNRYTDNELQKLMEVCLDG